MQALHNRNLLARLALRATSIEIDNTEVDGVAPQRHWGMGDTGQFAEFPVNLIETYDMHVATCSKI